MKLKYLVVIVIFFSMGALSFIIKKKSGVNGKHSIGNRASITKGKTSTSSLDAEITTDLRRVSINADHQVASSSYRFSKNLALTNIPTNLHAISAVEILAPDQVSSLLEGKTKEFTIPLSSDQNAKLSITKVVEGDENDILLVGNVIDSHVASYFDMKFVGGILESGIINLFGTDDIYRIRVMEEGHLIVALQDPKIPLGRCSCCSGDTIHSNLLE